MQKQNTLVYTRLELDELVLDSITSVHGPKLAVLSCLKCDCFRIEYNNNFHQDQQMPGGYKLVTDTNCNKFLFPVIHVPSNILERVSEDLYNVTFIAKKDTGYTYKILEPKNSKSLQKIADDFFKE